MTLSPIFTSIGMRCPSSNRPGPTAMTSPSWGFSLAVSGITIPETVVSSSSLGSTATRSSSGFNPNLVPMVPFLPRALVGGRPVLPAQLPPDGPQDPIEQLPVRPVGWPRRGFLELQLLRSGEREDDRVTVSRQPCGETHASVRLLDRQRHVDVPSESNIASLSAARPHHGQSAASCSMLAPHEEQDPSEPGDGTPTPSWLAERSSGIPTTIESRGRWLRTMPTISFPFPLRGRVWRLRSKPADLRCMLLQPPVLLGQAFPLLRQPNGVGVPGPLSGGGPAVKDGAAVPRPEQVRGGPDLRAPLVPADLPRLSERQVPTAVLESLQVEMGDPAELRHPGGHDHAAHGFALAALLEDRQSLTD